MTLDNALLEIANAEISQLKLRLAARVAEAEISRILCNNNYDWAKRVEKERDDLKLKLAVKNEALTKCEAAIIACKLYLDDDCECDMCKPVFRLVNDALAAIEAGKVGK